MTSQAPLLSICVPAYNAARFLPNLIGAIAEQSFKDWELVVVDNASTDGTADALKRLADERADPRIKIVSNKSTVPMADNWNIAVSHSTGEYLKLICADDLPYADCFERQVTVLRNNESISLVSGSRIIINGLGNRLFVRNGIGRTGVYEGKRMIRRCVMAGTNIIGDPVNVMWKRSAMDQIGLFNPAVVYCTDMEYWLRLLSVGDLYFDAEPSGLYRIHFGAAATGLAKVASEDIVKAAKLQAQRGSVQLSSSDLARVRFSAWWTGVLRQLIYKILG